MQSVGATVPDQSYFKVVVLCIYSWGGLGCRLGWGRPSGRPYTNVKLVSTPPNPPHCQTPAWQRQPTSGHHAQPSSRPCLSHH